MYTYTMTFVSGDVIKIPNLSSCDNLIFRRVTDKLIRQEMSLADFNWSGAYHFHNSFSYLIEPYYFNSVVEVRVKLDMVIIQNRQAIYERCLEALLTHEVSLKRIEYLNNNAAGKNKCVLCFDMKPVA